MDLFTSTKLKEWKLNQFQERFANAGIDEEMLNLIDDSMLENLFDAKSECGYMKRLKTRLEEMHAQKENHYVPIPRTQNEEVEELLTEGQANPHSHPSTHISIPTVIAVGRAQPLTNILNLPPHPLPSNIIITPPASEASFSSVSSEASSLDNEVTWKPRLGDSMPCERHTFKYLLDNTYRGFKIRTSTEKGTLETRIICDLIIDQEFERTKQFRITRDRFNELLDDLADNLEVEGKTKAQVKAIFYHPFRRASKTKKSVSAGGSTYDRYLSERKWLIRREVISKEQILQEDITATLAEEVLKFLYENDSPPDQVKLKWTESEFIRSPDSDYKNSFLLYKGLRLPTLGHILWSLDYVSMHGTSPDFKAEFEVLTPIIIAIAIDKEKILRTETGLNVIVKDYILALRCLVKILGKLFSKRDAKGELVYKFGGDPEHTQSSFFHHANSISEFEKFKSERLECSVVDKRTIGPFVTFVGDLSRDGLANVEGAGQISVFVTVNFIDFKIESNSLLDAIDFCYKSFSSLNIPYPIECHMVWIFLQRKIYQNDLEDIQDKYRTVDKFIDLIEKKSRA